MNTTSTLETIDAVKPFGLVDANGAFPSGEFARELFTRLVHLGPGWAVDSIDYDPASQTLELGVRETAELWEIEECSACKSRALKPHDRTSKRSWRHVDAFTRRTVVQCAIPRGRCGECGDIGKLKPAWLGKSKHFTREFEALALTLMKETAVKNVGKLLGETDQRLWRILYAYVEGARTELSKAAINVLKQQWNKDGI